MGTKCPSKAWPTVVPNKKALRKYIFSQISLSTMDGPVQVGDES